MVGCCIREPVDRRKVPVGLCYRLDAVDFEGSAPHFAVDVENHSGIAKSSLGGEVYAQSEMVDHILLLKDCYGPFEGANPGVVGLEGCESLFTHPKAKKMVAEKHPQRHFLSIQGALEEGDPENAYWLPGTEDPADSLTNVRRDVVPCYDYWDPVHFVWDISAS